MLLRWWYFINKKIQHLESYLKYHFGSKNILNKESTDIILMASIIFVFISVFGIIFSY